MKKRVLMLSMIVLGFFLISFAIVYWIRRSEDPEVLLKWLEANKGDHKEIVMRLNMARGDVTMYLLSAFQNNNKNDRFRTDILELLFKKNLRLSDERIEKALLASLHDSSTQVRKFAVSAFASYADYRLQPAIIPFINDFDPEIRKKVYEVFIGGDNNWENMSDSQKDILVNGAIKQKPIESDALLQFLNQSLIGKNIEQLCAQGLNSFQRMEFIEADSLFDYAMSIDSTNITASTVLANYYLKNNNREKALALARSHGILIEIPHLMQAPIIDGEPTDAVWNNAYQTNRTYIGNGLAFRNYSDRSKLYIGYSNSKLFCAVLCYENDVGKLKMTKAQRDADIWDDDCIEMILNPKLDRKRYCKIIINPSGSVYDRLGANSAYNFVFEYAVKVYPDRGYWVIEFAISGKELENSPIKKGDIWNVGFINNKIGCGSQRHVFQQGVDEDKFPLAIFK